MDTDAIINLTLLSKNSEFINIVDDIIIDTIAPIDANAVNITQKELINGKDLLSLKKHLVGFKDNKLISSYVKIIDDILGEHVANAFTLGGTQTSVIYGLDSFILDIDEIYTVCLPEIEEVKLKNSVNKTLTALFNSIKANLDVSLDNKNVTDGKYTTAAYSEKESVLYIGDKLICKAMDKLSDGTRYLLTEDSFEQLYHMLEGIWKDKQNTCYKSNKITILTNIDGIVNNEYICYKNSSGYCICRKP